MYIENTKIAYYEKKTNTETNDKICQFESIRTHNLEKSISIYKYLQHFMSLLNQVYTFYHLRHSARFLEPTY